MLMPTKRTASITLFVYILIRGIVYPSLLFIFISDLSSRVQGLRQQQHSGGGRHYHHNTNPPQRMCFQCHMPLQCKSGFCFGDYCVKSMVADKYVSKGCENRSSSILLAAATAANGGGQQRFDDFADASHGPLYARSPLNDGDNSDMHTLVPRVPLVPTLSVVPGCIKMNIFGQPNVICYCNDADYCNAATNSRQKTIAQIMSIFTIGTTTFFIHCFWRRFGSI